MGEAYCSLIVGALNVSLMPPEKHGKSNGLYAYNCRSIKLVLLAS